MPTVRLTVAILMAAIAAACSGDGGGSGQSQRDQLAVVASFYPLAEVLSRVGGDRVAVTNLTPPGVEPHDIELTPRQVDRLEDADVVVYLGRGFQAAVEDVAERRDGSTVDLFDNIEPDADADPGESEADPHVWLDPTLLAEAVDVVADALAEASSRDADLFSDNAKAYKAELEALDVEFADGVASCERREIVTSHAAFFYLARRYGLTQLPIAGLSPEAEPDADRLATLADEIETRGVTTVFYEELVSPEVAETLAREAGVATAVLNPIEGLSEEDVAAGKDYAAVMRDNLAALREALGCR
jgi:zinc transport system substrate-binding protein